MQRGSQPTTRPRNPLEASPPATLPYSPRIAVPVPLPDRRCLSFRRARRVKGSWWWREHVERTRRRVEWGGEVIVSRGGLAVSHTRGVVQAAPSPREPPFRAPGDEQSVQGARREMCGDLHQENTIGAVAGEDETTILLRETPGRCSKDQGPLSLPLACQAPLFTPITMSCVLCRPALRAPPELQRTPSSQSDSRGSGIHATKYLTTSTFPAARACPMAVGGPVAVCL